MTDSRPHDISIRLPANKKHLKEELLKISAENNISYTQLMVYVIEWFLDARKKKKFTIALK